jgi:hypothetical protein
MRRWAILGFVLFLALAGCGKDSILGPDKKANVVMIEGPVFVDGYTIFEYQGRVKNNGDATAKFAKVYIYLRRSDSSLIEQDYSYVDDTDLASGETSPWDVLFSDDDHVKRNIMDKSKMTYEIKWD